MDIEKKNDGVLTKQEHPIYIVSQPIDANDEINIIELMDCIWKRRVFLLIWCFIITLTALIVAINQKKSYKAEALFYPPKVNDVRSIDVQNVYAITEYEVYGNLLKNLKLESLRKSVFDEFASELEHTRENAFLTFNQRIALKESKADKKSLSISIHQ